MTKLRLVIGDRDEKYIKRLSDYITFHYGEKIEIYSFTELGLLEAFLQKNQVNSVLVGKSFLRIRETIPQKTVFVYLSEGIETENHENMHTLLKYQSVDALVKEIMSLCSEQISGLFSGKRPGERGRVILFESPAGGVGTTTIAASCAIYFARQGKKVLYVNLESFGGTEDIFSCEGRFDFGDVIYALMSRKANLSLKLESVVKQDISGVCFIEPCRKPMDLRSLKAEDAVTLFETLSGDGIYDYIIVDRNSGLESLDDTLRGLADEIILVTNGYAAENRKLQKFYQTICIYEEKENAAISGKMKILYNEFSNQMSQKLEGEQPAVLGGFPRFERMTQKRIVEQLAAKDVFGKL